MPSTLLKTAPVSLARSVSTVYMSLDEWNAIPTFMSQRNHEQRAKDPNHIRKFATVLKTHVVVSAAVLPNGDMFKLDGHTRPEIWKLKPNGDIPNEVLCLVFAVENLDEARELYLSIDSKRAVKTAMDEIFSAMRESEFKPVSPLISSCKFNEALSIAGRRAGRGYSKMEQVRDMISILKTFDKLLPTATTFVTPVAAAAMLSIMRDDEKALPFWEQYASGKWADNSAIAALDAYINAVDDEGNKTTVWGKRADNIQVTGRCLSLYMLWFSNPARVVDAKHPYGVMGATVIKNFKAALPS